MSSDTRQPTVHLRSAPRLKFPGEVDSNSPAGTDPYSVDAGANGDINGDDFVDPSDFDLYLAAEFSFCGAGNYNPAADLNGDGFVDPLDFDIYVANEFAFGDGCGCP